MSAIKRWQVSDRRSRRYLLDPEIFLDGSNPPPSDLIDLSLWDHLMHLADHVSITTSNHHGQLLKRLYDLERGWIHAIGEPHDWLSDAMVDVMDEFHASLFLLLHGFYRQSIATLRSVLETTLIGASLKLSGDKANFRSWRAGDKEFGFGGAADKIRTIPAIKAIESKLRRTTGDDIFSQRSSSWKGGWSRRLYGRLCEYSHSRPGHTNVDLWRSNGPIYVTRNVQRTAALYVETFTLSMLIVQLARPERVFGHDIPRGFERSRASWARLARQCYSLME
ncbi:MAG: hypothetical protein WB760_25180 [Xanthobacteraceae bacterium]